ncbi:hypothetical protein C8R44DRAFT_171390 [Mycena epipterygia]|nr:hypothetical protein C8R44DRAFT_171390 [Mycena epipterygia]
MGKRSKLTLKKANREVRVALGREKNAPTEAEWDTMQIYFTFQDEDGNDYDFSKNEIARILPNGRRVGAPIELHEYWICRILEIRAKNPSDVWVRVEWFYSARDAAGVIPAFDPSHCGQYERLRSNHIDCISSSVFDGMASVKEYDETALEQDTILDDDFYYRYTLDLAPHGSTISPNPGATCTCTSPYNPSDAHPKSLMHFCLQPECRKYYHSGCIAPQGKPLAADRDRGFLFCDPDTGLPLELDDAMSSASGPLKKKKRRTSQATNHTPVASPTAVALLDALPPALVNAAAQPIVKGAAFAAGGVVGNIPVVLTARRLVFAALRDGRGVADGWQAQMPDGWEVLVEIKLGGETGNTSRRVSLGKGKGKAKAKDDMVLALECPKCGGPI